jgi:hypothetical protein
VVYGSQVYQSLSPGLPEILPALSPIINFGGYHQAQ